MQRAVGTLVFVFGPVDRMVRVSLRSSVAELPSQDVITRDNVSVSVNAVIDDRVVDPLLAILQVAN